MDGEIIFAPLRSDDAVLIRHAAVQIQLINARVPPSLFEIGVVKTSMIVRGCSEEKTDGHFCIGKKLFARKDRRTVQRVDRRKRSVDLCRLIVLSV